MSYPQVAKYIPCKTWTLTWALVVVMVVVPGSLQEYSPESDWEQEEMLRWEVRTVLDTVWPRLVK